MSKVSAVNEVSGEVIELDVNNLADLVIAWKLTQQYDKLVTKLKDQLKPLVKEYVNERGQSDEVEGSMFKVNSIQRMTYDKSVVRELLDADTFDLFTKIDKSALDKFIKENLDKLGDVSTQLRQSMVEDGKAYEVIKLERVK